MMSILCQAATCSLLVIGIFLCHAAQVVHGAPVSNPVYNPPSNSKPLAAPIAKPAPVKAAPSIYNNPVPLPVSQPVPAPSPVSSGNVTQINTALINCKNDLIALIQANNTIIPKFIRLIFHDCVGGKCDGCVNLGNIDNKGLEEPTSLLERTLVPKYRAWLSRADIWMLAAMAAAEVAQPAGSSRVTFDLTGYGRKDCGSSFTAGPNPSLPSPHLTTAQLLKFFQENFNYTTKQTVAIMGAHALGRVHAENSGFDGDHWTVTPLTLKNSYYKTMLTSDFTRVKPAYERALEDEPPFSKRFYWIDLLNCTGCGEENFLLNVDVGLAVNLQGYIDPKNGNVSCALAGSVPTIPKMPTCPASLNTLTFAAQFAKDNTLFLLSFREALLQMSNVGYRTTSGCGQPICPLQAL